MTVPIKAHERNPRIKKAAEISGGLLDWDVVNAAYL